MKESRTTYKSLGIVLIVFLVLYGFIRQYVIAPLIGKMWGLVLMSTPDGYLCEKNIVEALQKSPWIIIAGLLLVIIYAIISIWPLSAIIVGIGYIRQNKQIKFYDLINISLIQLKDRDLKDNWMMVLYSFIILPLTNVYQTSDIFGSFVIPEYIQDFIETKTVLFILFVILALFVIYIGLRWAFILPAFILKRKDFNESRSESDLLTAGCYIKNGINIALYTLIEILRLSIIPITLLMIPVFICYLCTHKMVLATSLYNAIGISIGLELAQNITGTLVEISSLCFLVGLYFERQKECNTDDTVLLPKLEKANKSKITITRLEVIVCSSLAVLLAAMYLFTVSVAQKNNSIIFDLFGKTDIIAHKGYSSKAPENTMAAFKLADEYEPVTYIELDVWSSKDGVPVVIHNKTIMDATGVDKNIYDCTCEELQKLPAPYSWDESEFKDARIPSLEEVIAGYSKTTPLLIEIKGYDQDPELPKKIVELMEKYECEDTSIIHSGNYEALKAVKQINPHIRCGLILAMVTGNYYNLPYADFFSIEHTFVDQNQIAVLHRHGKDVYAWTVNYDTSAEDLRFTDVDGIITDVPEQIYEYVSDSNDLVDDALRINVQNAIADERKNALERFANEEY